MSFNDVVRKGLQNGVRNSSHGADWLLVSSLKLTAPNPIDTEIFNKLYFARLYDGVNRSRD